MIYENIRSEIKQAMKDNDSVKRDCLKNVLGKAQESVKNNGRKHIDLDAIPDDVMIEAIQREAKQLNQTINSLKGCEEVELYSVSVNQLEILSDYIPEQMTKTEVEEAVSWILENDNSNNFGQRMKIVMKELRGKADSNIIREVVSAYK